VVKPSRRKEMAQRARAHYGVSIRVACLTFNISETCYRYQAKLGTENAVIADWLLRLTTTHKRWGFGLCYYYLRNTQGYAWNHKRIYRIYRELELNLRIKPRRRIKRDKPDAIRCDNGPEYISQKLIDWTNKQKITLLYIQPGKPTQNAYIERFNRTARHEWLDLHLFKSIEHAQQLATKWLWCIFRPNLNTHSGLT